MNKRKYGVLLGVERGKEWMLEIGGEAQFKKIKLKRPPMFAVNMVMNYGWQENILGYQVGGWYKKGRVGLTWGGYFNLLTDFEQTKIGFAPAIGYKLIGFHFQTGYKFLTKAVKEMEGQRVIFNDHNTFFVSLRYYLTQRRKTKMEATTPFSKKK